jgi:hypothetical protein
MFVPNRKIILRMVKEGVRQFVTLRFLESN